MDWTLERIRHFVAVAETGSMTQAAKELGKVQSAVSTSISLLEADLNLELFDRSRRTLSLTVPGEIMLLEAKALLRQADGLNRRALDLSQGQSARLEIGLDEALPQGPLRLLLKELAVRWPALELTIWNGTAAEVMDYLGEGRSDVAIQFDRGADVSSFAQSYIGAVPQAICVARTHQLASQQQVSRKELTAHRQLLIHIEGVEQTVVRPSVWRSDSFYVIADMVADGLGWAILPLNIAEYESLRNKLAQLHCKELALPPLSVQMLWRQGQSLATVAVWMQQRLSELLP
ncbi:LysR family transcriptional regulator [Alcaligenes aquatilis]|uniref:LysR family transcriptional regulator n=1 Tax=Alcaligenes aquatilis TaxID=323284 RepID=UPI000D52A906|nr:LysR family transcriptional regulator [Alcaligenes aquatilis]AWG34931.1 LysR family transcriptional regulator [Alcaligenes aquatilis]